MLSPSELFERDRRHFLWLLGLLADHLQLALDAEPSFPPITGIISEIENLELAERCGLAAPPFELGERVDEDGWSRTYEWRHPFQHSPVQMIVTPTGQGWGDDASRLQEVAARKELGGAVRLWSRAVESMLVPSAFSLLSGTAVPGRDPALARDRLWLHLRKGAWTYRGGCVVRPSDWSYRGAFFDYVRKVNALARYEGLTTETVFHLSRVVVLDGHDTWIGVTDPRDGSLVRIAYKQGSVPGPDECARLHELITLWMGAREAQLVPRAKPDAHVETLLSSASRGANEDLIPPDERAARGLDPNLSDPEKLKHLSPAERTALEQFLEACVSAELSSIRATEEHWEASGKPGSWAAWRRNVSEALRKVMGPAKDRGDALSRSVISIAERPERGD